MADGADTEGAERPWRGVERRGPFRPRSLASGRARQEARTAERLVQGLEAALVISMALAICADSHPQGLLLAPLAGVLPFAAGAPAMIWALDTARATSTRLREGLRRSLARACAGLLLAGTLVGGLVGLLPVTPTQTQAVCLWFALGAAAVLTLHILWWWRIDRLRRDGRLTPNIVIVGANANAGHLVARARQSGEFAVLGVFDDRFQPGGSDRIPRHVGGVPVLGTTAALLEHRIMPYIDRVVITVPSGAQRRIRELIERLRQVPNEISLLLDVDGDIQTCSALSCLGHMPLTRLSAHRVADSRAMAKRLQDLVLGTAALIAVAPLMVLLALAVKLDSPGPVFFRQRRHGLNNEPIVVWKFRSMRHAAQDATAARQVGPGDDRVTRLGRFMRRNSLDELPQLFNVLRGEMSLVGPRPHAIGMKTGDIESARLVAEYGHRHRMKPGLTGWAAIKGSRGPVDTIEAVRRRVALDVEYIERQSFWLDVYILLMTLPR
jgi:Undecaprenyl-phosphate glucose phosphotransferase